MEITINEGWIIGHLILKREREREVERERKKEKEREKKLLLQIEEMNEKFRQKISMSHSLSVLLAGLQEQ